MIELLVVVAIIAVLVAVLLPALAAARSRARVILCEGNLRQIGIDLELYCDNYSGYYPPIFDYQPWQTAWDYPLYCLFEHHSLSSPPKVIVCPADTLKRYSVPRTYVFQWRMLPKLDTQEPPEQVAGNWGHSIRPADITDGLTDTVIMVENPASTNVFTNASDAFRWIGYPPSNTGLPDVHHPGNTTLYGDGHVRFCLNIPFEPLWREFTPNWND